MYKRGNMRTETWLSQLLIATIRHFGGEGGAVRLSWNELEDVTGRYMLITTHDHAKHEIVLQYGAGDSEAIVVNTEQQWTHREAATEPINETNSQPSSPRQSSGMLSDAALAQIERSLLEKAGQRQREKAEQDRLRARREVFQE